MLQSESNDLAEDVTLLDVDSLFVAEIVQESLLIDAYATAQPIEPEENVFDETDIRGLMYGPSKHKAPALMRMLRLVLGQDTDFVQAGARALLNSR